MQTIFNNDHDNSSGLGVGKDKEYIKVAEGRLFDPKGIKARYVRMYSNGEYDQRPEPLRRDRGLRHARQMNRTGFMTFVWRTDGSARTGHEAAARVVFGGVVLAGLVLALTFRLARADLRPMHHDEANQAVKFGELLETGDYRYDRHDHHGPTLHYLTLPAAWLRGQRTLASLDERTAWIGPFSLVGNFTFSVLARRFKVE